MFNRGNQRQTIFLQERNYFYFLEKVRKTFVEGANLLAYCLMPNHFHFLLSTDHNFRSDPFSKRLAIMLRSYTRGIQMQEKFVGSLFQQNTKKKELPQQQDAFNCFQYIHQNPIKASLVERLEEWPFSSFNEYLLSAPDICSVDLGRKLLDLPSRRKAFYRQSASFVEHPNA